MGWMRSARARGLMAETRGLMAETRGLIKMFDWSNYHSIGAVWTRVWEIDRWLLIRLNLCFPTLVVIVVGQTKSGSSAGHGPFSTLDCQAMIPDLMARTAASVLSAALIFRSTC